MNQIQRLSDADEICRLVAEQVQNEKIQYTSSGKLNEENTTNGDHVFTSTEIWEALSRNQDGDSWLYCEIHRGRFCYDVAAGRWYQWGPHHWQKDILNDALRGIDNVIDIYGQELSRLSWQQEGQAKAGKNDEARDTEKKRKILLTRIAALQSITRKEHVLKLARTGSDSLALPGNKWDINPMLLGVQNGVVDLTYGELRPGKPEDYIKTVAPVEYRGLNEPAPTWDRFQSEICNDDQCLVDFKQRLYGYSITGKTSEHIFPIQHGEGANGKSTEDETIASVMGDYAGQVEAEMLLSQRNGRHSGGPSPDIMSLQGRRFVYCSETERGRRFNVSKLKWLTGGDSLTGRDLYAKDAITFRPTHKIFLSTNHKPHVSDDDFAFWRRATLIPYSMAFVSDPEKPNERKADPNLLAKLRDEASGILAWLIRGCLAWQREGLNPPGIVKVATQAYRGDEDTLGHFINERCIIGSDKTVKSSLLYEAYKKWCADMGCTPLNGMNFGLKIKTQFDFDQNYKGIFYQGIGLLAGTKPGHLGKKKSRIYEQIR